MEELLQKIGWTRAYFAQRVGVDRKTVGRWCDGQENSIAMAYLELVAGLVGE